MSDVTVAWSPVLVSTRVPETAVGEQPAFIMTLLKGCVLSAFGFLDSFCAHRTYYSLSGLSGSMHTLPGKSVFQTTHISVALKKLHALEWVAQFHVYEASHGVVCSHAL